MSSTLDDDQHRFRTVLAGSVACPGHFQFIVRLREDVGRFELLVAAVQFHPSLDRLFDRLPPQVRERIALLTLDFSRFDKSLSPKGRFSRAVFRRLFLDEILPARFERIVTVDSDMLIVRPGLSRRRQAAVP